MPALGDKHRRRQQWRPGIRIHMRLMTGHYDAPRIMDGLPVQLAPSIESLRWRAEVEPGPIALRHLRRQGMLEAAPLNATAMAFFAPFPAADTDGPVLYLALASQERSLASRTLNVQVEPGAPDGGAPPAPVRTPTPMPTWQRRTVDGWRDCAVVDGPAGLMRLGIVAIDLSNGLAAWTGSALNLAGRPV